MKKILFILLIVNMVSPKLAAQYNVTLFIAHPAPNYLGDWNKGSSGLLTIVYTSRTVLTSQVRFQTQLQHMTGEIIAISKDASATVYTIQKGANTFSLDKCLQLDNLQFFDATIIKRIQTSGRLPAGNYQLCLQLINSNNSETLIKAPVCRTFVQANCQLPILLMPENKVILNPNEAQNLITFRWSSLIPQIEKFVTYRLQVFEVLEGQENMQALRSNQPILDVDLQNTTQYFWRPQLYLKDSAEHLFIWTVQTLDSRGMPVQSTDDNNQGRSEPRVFCVGSGNNNELYDASNDSNNKKGK